MLFPDPQPLVERLGRDFFRQFPEGPGVYLMRDAHEAILYIGKAKNLRKRLGFSGLPVGWFRGRLDAETVIHCGPMIETVASNLSHLLAGHTTEFCGWIRTRLPNDLYPFEKTAVEADLEFLSNEGRGGEASTHARITSEFE
ncbi:MAG: GIY-YIG nuclease family protein [Verrucomicrobia bacterium]|nr:GIY-YIG nuclease family protein [Verrucomicrobiota bacterium]